MRTVVKPETSIVIRTFNEEKHLPRLLAGIERQRYRDYEVVVVDSGSRDRTPEITRQYGHRVLHISSRDFTFGYSLNVGVSASVGRFVAIVSAHTEPVDDSWLQRLVAPLNSPETAMVYGRQLGNAASKLSEARDFRRTFGEQRQVMVPPNFFANNANSGIRRDLWLERPFDEALPGLEDIEWAKNWMKRGYRVLYEPGAAIYHIHEESWRQVRRRYYREGLAAKWLGIKGRRHAIAEIACEGISLLGDLVEAGRTGELSRRTGEIVCYRTNKALGTIQGLLDGAAMASPSARDAMFFDRT